MNKLTLILLSGFFLLSPEGFAQEKWFAIFGRDDDVEQTGYNRTNSRWELESEIEQRWKDGYDLLEIEYGEGHWYAIFGKSRSISQTSYFSSTKLIDLEYHTNTQFNDGFLLLDVEYGNGIWYAIYGRNEEFEKPYFSRNRDIKALQREIDNKWQDGYELIDIEFGENVWYSVFAQVSNQNRREEVYKQSGYNRIMNLWEMEYNFSQRWKDDYDLLDIEYGNGQWYAVFAKKLDLELSAYNRSDDLIKMEYEIKQRWDDEFDLINIGWGGERLRPNPPSAKNSRGQRKKQNNN